MIAIGIGCRRGASQAQIAAAIQEALAKAQTAGEPASLFSIDAKRDEAGLVGAADELGLPLEFFPPRWRCARSKTRPPPDPRQPRRHGSASPRCRKPPRSSAPDGMPA